MTSAEYTVYIWGKCLPDGEVLVGMNYINFRDDVTLHPNNTSVVCNVPPVSVDKGFAKIILLKMIKGSWCDLSRGLAVMMVHLHEFWNPSNFAVGHISRVLSTLELCLLMDTRSPFVCCEMEGGVVETAKAGQVCSSFRLSSAKPQT